MSTSSNYAKYSGLAGSGGGGGSGTVTSVSVATANGFAGTVVDPTTAAILTISTTVTGILQGNGTAISAATVGNLTESTSDVLTIAGGTSSVLGSGVTIDVKKSGTSQDGYLSSTDWNTFNGKQAAGSYITALTGDGTASGPGSAALTLATVNTNVGTFASFTVNGKGLITAATALSGDATTSGAVLTLATVNSNVGTFASFTVNGKGLITAATALSGDATTSGAVLTLATVNTNTGSFGSSTAIPSFTVNGKGLLTAASTNVVIAPAGTLTGTTLASNVVTSSLTTLGIIGTGTWQGTAITVPYGGTGAASFTAYAPVIGGTSSTGALTSASSGISNSGYILTSTGSSSTPTFQAPVGGTTSVGPRTAFASVAAGTLITATTTNPTYGTVAQNIASYQITTCSDGSYIGEYWWDFSGSGNGNDGSGTILFNLPSGHTINTTLAPAYTGTSIYSGLSYSTGTFYSLRSPGTLWLQGFANVYSTTQMSFTYQAFNGSIVAATQFWLAASGLWGSEANTFSVYFKVPLSAI